MYVVIKINSVAKELMKHDGKVSFVGFHGGYFA